MNEAPATTCERCGSFVTPGDTQVIGVARVCLACAERLRRETPLHPRRRLLFIGCLANAAPMLYLLSVNASRLGLRDDARRLRIWAGVVALVLVGLTRVPLPSGVTIGLNVGVTFLAANGWTERLDEHFRKGGAREPLWRALLAVAVSMAVIIGLSVLID